MSAPNIVTEVLKRGQSLLQVANTPATVANIIAATTVTEVAFTIPGVNVGDFISCAPMAALPAGVAIAYARVSAANTVQVGFVKVTAGTTQDAAGYYLFKVLRAYPTPSSIVDFGVKNSPNAGPIPLSS